MGSASAAGAVENATIIEISLNRNYGEYAFIRMSQSPTGAPECSTNGYWHFTLPLDSAIGKELYAILLTAMAARIPVIAVGLGVCTEQGTVESLAALNPKP